ncbi:MAG: prolipoprotein diacylglyceryl transferase [Atopostipes sp.]|nr:prolipoprotein diacylglyceryl transferase [Atopostipes sp.]
MNRIEGGEMFGKMMAIDPIAFELGPFSVAWYGLIIVTGMILAISLIIREGEKRDLTEDFIVDTAFWAIPIGIIGARLYYVLFELDVYLQNPIRILYVWEGGLAIYGGIIGGLIAIYYQSKKEKVPLLLLTDVVTPYLLLAQGIGRWGNFINQEAHGGEVSRQFLEKLHLPDFIIEQMHIAGSYYHPTFLYESVWNILGMFIILAIRKKENFLLRGEATASYLIWYGLGRFFIEGMRTDSLYIGPLRVSQILSLLMVIGGLAFIYYQRKINYPRNPYYTEGLTPERTFAKKKEKYDKEK